MRASFDVRVKKKSKSKVKEIEEIAFLRDKLGLSPIIRKNRNCMRCGVQFISEGNWNRLCWTCGNALDNEGC